MSPTYKFELQVATNSGTVARTANPIWPSGLAKEISRDSNEQFYRSTLSGKLTFIHGDYDFIMSETIDTRFELLIYISYDNGINYQEYWHGKFFLTDCEIDVDSKTCIVAPSADDDYEYVLAGLDKEFNLLDLGPEVQSIKVDKRPLIQVYSPGESVVGCFLAGMWWEQECDPVSNITALRNTFHFYPSYSVRKILVSGSMSPQLPSMFTGAVPTGVRYTYINGPWQLWVFDDIIPGPTSPQQVIRVQIRNGRYDVMWEYIQYAGSLVYPVTLSPVAGSGASGNVTLNKLDDTQIFTRMVCDVSSVPGTPTYPIPGNDFVLDNRNYHYCIGYPLNGAIYIYSSLSDNPTKWGKAPNGKYYEQPGADTTVGPTFPIARAQWENYSIWFRYPEQDFIVESKCRKEFILKDAYPLASVIQVLLNEVAPDIHHEAKPEYSQFLYGETDIYHPDYRLFIAPKTNILVSDYDEPAQKAPITLKQIFDMLRSCFKCYWFIDTGENNIKRLRIEQIHYFNKGQSYSGAPEISLDLTKLTNLRNGKALSFATNKYSYNKPEMPERFEFKWADDCTELFEGYPIEVRSKYVELGNIEEINVAGFVSDIDYMLLAPDKFSEDGFALIAGALINDLAEDISITIDDTGYYRWDSVEQYAGQHISLTIRTGGGTAELTQISARRPAGEYIGAFGSSKTTFEFDVRADVIGLLIEAQPWTTVTISAVSLGEYKVPYLFYNANIYLQNGVLAFCELQRRYYIYDMPSNYVYINGEQISSFSVKRSKLQTINITTLEDPNVYALIKTGLGNGAIQKASINLSSRNAKITLEHNNE